MGTVTPPGERAAAEVQEILQSALFVRSPRLARLLDYLCTKYFAGETDQIKEYNIAVEVLDRPDSFDPAEDAIARVEVHRLRKKLREYYAAEGARHSLRVVIPPGHYVPVFVPAEEAATHEEPQSPQTANGNGHLNGANGTGAALNGDGRNKLRSLRERGAVTWLIAGSLLAVSVIIAFRGRSTANPHAGDGAAVLSAAAIIPGSLPVLPAARGEEVRFLCGRTKPFTDREGRKWSGDRYFEGGEAWTPPERFLARTSEPFLFEGARSGNFSYRIPLDRGVYELHLYFAETAFGPGTAGGGGENSRVFHIAMNGKRLLSDFDIIADAGGPGIADERVFKDISPGPDGALQLRFIDVRGPAIVNAIELVPAWPHHMNPVRIYISEKSYTDSQRSTWLPDNFWSGGQPANGSSFVEGSQDPAIYARERYGHFSYAIPVDQGQYGVSLHFAETYWGQDNPGGGGAGTRIFNVFANGTALLRSFDIYKEAGANRALVKTFHGLQPNAQGKLVLAFEPVRNYASVRAIEVVDESR
ncbi:MAG TPA: malectin domain-containing carbohydrate-binding protein [Bryobacteraceae bacterium]|nr:malectin domain-containing carbohydrate-binding protein [Bryobacteraceae bacterium]